MVFLFGLLLAPIGAAIGSAILITFILVLTSSFPVPLSEWLRMVLFAAGIGMTAALPTTVLALPATYLVIRRHSAATATKLAAAGALAGFLISGGIVLGYFGLEKVDDPVLWGIVGGIGADGAFAGAVCGATLGWMMRRWQPQRAVP